MVSNKFYFIAFNVYFFQTTKLQLQLMHKKKKSLETQDMSVIYRSLALLIHEGGSDMACSYKALLQLWFAEPKASTEHSRICDHIDLWGILALRWLKTQRDSLRVRSLCSFSSHPILLPKSWMNWKSHLQPVLARLL